MLHAELDCLTCLESLSAKAEPPKPNLKETTCLPYIWGFWGLTHSHVFIGQFPVWLLRTCFGDDRDTRSLCWAVDEQLRFMGAEAAFAHFMIGEWQNFVSLRRKHFKNVVRGRLSTFASRGPRILEFNYVQLSKVKDIWLQLLCWTMFNYVQAEFPRTFQFNYSQNYVHVPLPKVKDIWTQLCVTLFKTMFYVYVQVPNVLVKLPSIETDLWRSHGTFCCSSDPIDLGGEHA